MPGSYLDGMLTEVVSSNGTQVAKVGGAFGRGVNFLAPLTATPNSATGNVDVGVSGTPSLGAITATSITVGTGTWTSGPVVTTTDNSTVSLVPGVVIPALKDVTFAFRVKGWTASAANVASIMVAGSADFTLVSGAANLVGFTGTESQGTSGPLIAGNLGQQSVAVTGAANNGSGLVRLTVTSTSNIPTGTTVTVAGITGTGGLPAAANGTWAVNQIDGTHIDLRGSAFAGAYTSGGTVTSSGCFQLGASGTSALLQVIGITAAAWIQSEVVRFGDVRSNASGAWLCSQAGTTSNVGTGPSGSGTVTGVVDGGAKWDRLGAGPGVPVSWQLVKLETF